MYRIVINTELLASISQEIARLKNAMDDIACSVNICMRETSRVVNSQTNITASMRKENSRINACAERTGKLSSSVRSAGAIWENCEKKLAGMQLDSGGGDGGGMDEQPSNKKYYAFDWRKLVFSAIGKAGLFGGIISALGYADDQKDGNNIKMVASLYKTYATWNEGIKKGLSKKERLLGLDKYLKNPSTKVGWAGFSENFGNSFKSGMTKKSSWIAAAFTTGVDNYNEYQTGAISSDRAIVEWAAETAGTVALGAATTALVGAGLATVGIAGAPVVLVGAAAAAVTTVADWAFKNTIGDGRGLVETAGHYVGELYDTTKDAISRVGKSICTRAENVFADWGRKLNFAL